MIDSQGDLIDNILALDALPPDRLVYINPRDIKFPPALNLFDIGQERIDSYEPVEREQLINGAIELYDYIFGALLGAELTQRQGVTFDYLARLMMVVPNARLETLIDFIEEPDTVVPYLAKLDPTTQRFFKKQFFNSAFDSTRQQILARLYDVANKQSLANMFNSAKNKINLFDALNKGSIILVYTAKDFLREEGCQIFGRFFVALLSQAIQERAAIAGSSRTATFVYIDEASEYFGDDRTLSGLFNSARKYSCGLTIAHQNLNQLSQDLRATITSSTAIKLAGGLSKKDAAFFAEEMRTTPEKLLEMKKDAKKTEFAIYIRNQTAEEPDILEIPLGLMESQRKKTKAAYDAMIEQNRQRVSEARTEPTGLRPPEHVAIEEPGLL